MPIFRAFFAPERAVSICFAANLMNLRAFRRFNASQRKLTMPPAKKAPAKKAAAKPAGAKKTPSVLTLKHLAADLANSHDVPKKQMEGVLNDFVTLIGKNLKKGAKLRITGLGILQVRHRPARMGRNPATGEAIKIKASKKIAFRPAKDLKQSI
jgi:DNA-binding protein HU-beta